MLSPILRLQLQILFCQQQAQVKLFLPPRTLSTLTLVGVRDQGCLVGKEGQNGDSNTFPQQSCGRTPCLAAALAGLLQKCHLFPGLGWYRRAGHLSFPMLQPWWRRGTTWISLT